MFLAVFLGRSFAVFLRPAMRHQAMRQRRRRFHVLGDFPLANKHRCAAANSGRSPLLWVEARGIFAELALPDGARAACPAAPGEAACATSGRIAASTFFGGPIMPVIKAAE